MTKNKYLKEACYIDGSWISNPAASIDVYNPANQTLLGSVPDLQLSHITAAIDAASEAFSSWSKMPAAERSALMLKLHDAMIANQSILAELLTLEMGKPLAEAFGEVGIAAAYIKWFAEEARRVYGDVLPSPWQDRRLLVTKEPVGVVAAITPWNFPSSMIARKLGAGLAAGCSLVIKPASQTPYSTLALAALCEEVGFPKGVVNVITGDPKLIGDEVCRNPKVRKITFTGSTHVGRQLAAAAAGNMKRISMELGGNAPFIVFEDADLDAAVEGAFLSKFRNAGQTCVSANRFIVHESIQEAFVKRLAAKLDSVKLGDGTDTDTNQGPLIDERAADRVMRLLDDAVSKGAHVRAGGTRHELGDNFVLPTIVTDVSDNMAVASEEIFGPLAPIFTFTTEAEALAMANNTEYGLACYFYTQDNARIWRMMAGLEYGMIGVNEGFIATEVAPFGGFKDSGFGNEGSKYGLDDYLNIKYTCVGGL